MGGEEAEDGLPSLMMSYSLLLRLRAAGSFSVMLSMVINIILGVRAVIALVGEDSLGFPGSVYDNKARVR